MARSQRASALADLSQYLEPAVDRPVWLPKALIVTNSPGWVTNHNSTSNAQESRRLAGILEATGHGYPDVGVVGDFDRRSVSIRRHRGLPWSVFPVFPEPAYRLNPVSAFRSNPDGEPLGVATGGVQDVADWLDCGTLIVIVPEVSEGVKAILNLEPDWTESWLHLVASTFRPLVSRCRLVITIQNGEATMGLPPGKPDPREAFDQAYCLNFAAIAGRAYRHAFQGMYTSQEFEHLLRWVERDPNLLQAAFNVRRTAWPTGSEDGVWRGSGKYRSLSIIPDAARELSHALIAAGIVERTFTDGGVWQGPFKLTAHGQKFLDILHPDNEDPDFMLRWHGRDGAEIDKARQDWLMRNFTKMKRRVSELTDQTVSPV